MDILNLWLPIVVSAVAIFIASSVIWMATPIHKKDYRPLGSAEQPISDAVRAAALPAGQYMFPGGDCEAMKDPVVIEKWKRGPWGVVNVMGSAPNMGATMGLWMLNLLVISALVGYLATFTVPPGAEKAFVARVIAVPAFLAFGGQIMCDSIWKGRPWSLAPGALFDAVVYTALMCTSFALLWPKWPAA